MRCIIRVRNVMIVMFCLGVFNVFSMYEFQGKKTDVQNERLVLQKAAEKLIIEDPSNVSSILYSKWESSESEYIKAQYEIALSKSYNEKRQCDSIKYWADIAQKTFLSIKNEKGKAQALYQQGYADLCNAKHEDALEKTLAGIQIMESRNDDHGRALGYMRMARIFHFSRKVEEEAEYGTKAAEIFDKLNDPINAADAWSYAVIGLRMSGQQGKSYSASQRLIANAKETGVDFLMALAHNGAASHFCQFDHFDSTYHHRALALNYIENTGSRFEMIIRNNIAMDYFYAEDYETCIPLLKEFLEYVKETDEVFFMAEMPRYISDAYAGLGQHDSAYHYMRLNWQFNDSLFTANQDKALQDMRTKYETEQKETSIKSLNKSVDLQRWLLILGGAFLLFSFYAIYNFRKLNGQLKIKNSENVILLKEIHHRVKNNLQILSSLLSLQSDHLVDTNAIDAIKEGRNRVESMGMIHQRLYGETGLNTVNMSDYGKELCRHLEDSFSSSKKKITIEDEISYGGMDVDYAIPLGLIINELVTNSIKYAFDGKDEGTLQVKLFEQADKLVLNVSDDGRGTASSELSVNSTSFGSKLISALNKKLKGDMTIDQTNGYSCVIEFARYKKQKDR